MQSRSYLEESSQIRLREKISELLQICQVIAVEEVDRVQSVLQPVARVRRGIAERSVRVGANLKYQFDEKEKDF